MSTNGKGDKRRKGIGYSAKYPQITGPNFGPKKPKKKVKEKKK